MELDVSILVNSLLIETMSDHFFLDKVGGTSVESLTNAAYMDFEIDGIDKLPETMKPAIFGILIGNKYACFILNQDLKFLSELFPEYCYYGEFVGYTVQEDISQWALTVDEEAEGNSVWCWSRKDMDWYKEYIGDLKHIFQYSWNARKVAKTQGNRLRLGLKRPHALKKYMKEVGHKYPSSSPANLIRELIQFSKQSQITDERCKKLAYDLMCYNYHDCFGIREILMHLFHGSSPFEVDQFFEVVD
jgi:hypothetical protein